MRTGGAHSKTPYLANPLQHSNVSSLLLSSLALACRSARRLSLDIRPLRWLWRWDESRRVLDAVWERDRLLLAFDVHETIDVLLGGGEADLRIANEVLSNSVLVVELGHDDEFDVLGGVLLRHRALHPLSSLGINCTVHIPPQTISVKQVLENTNHPCSTYWVHGLLIKPWEYFRAIRLASEFNFRLIRDGLVTCKQVQNLVYLDFESGICQVRTLGPRLKNLNLLMVIFFPNLITNYRWQVIR